MQWRTEIYERNPTEHLLVGPLAVRSWGLALKDLIRAAVALNLPLGTQVFTLGIPSQNKKRGFSPWGMPSFPRLVKKPQKKSSKTAQKSHVKPQTHLTAYTPKTSRWHVYPLQSATIKLASKIETSTTTKLFLI